MITAANVTMQFGAQPLFENISVKFGGGNRYGLIGANGCGKSTLMKILDGSLAPSAGNVSVTPDERIGKLHQDQFAFEQYSVIDTVIMGHTELWAVKQERDRIYGLAHMSDEDGMKVAELETRFAEMDGYTAESRAGEILLGAGIPTDFHFGPMSEVAPGTKLRVLLAQALFSDPDILLLDEPTNNLDINTIRWLEGVLNARKSTMVIISHDRHFLNATCTHMADIDYGELRVYPGNYDDYMTAATQARERLHSENAKKSAQIADLQQFVSRFSANASKAKQATSRAKQIEKIKLDEIKASSRQSPYIRFKQEKKLHRQAVVLENLGHGFEGQTLFSGGNLLLEAGTRLAVIGENGAGKTTFLRSVMGFTSVSGTIRFEGEDITGLIPARRPGLGIGYAPEDRRLFSAFTVEENILLPAQVARLDAAETKRRVERVYHILPELKEMAGRPAGNVSGGQGKMVALGRALMLGTKLVMLDEPFQGLAPALAMRYADALKALRDADRNVTLIITESNPSLLRGFADRTLLIERGEVSESSLEHERTDR